MNPVYLMTLFALGGGAESPTQPSPAESPAAVSSNLPQDAAKEEPRWTGSLNAGATYTSGNTDTQSVNVGIDMERRAEVDRYTLRGWWNYGEQNDALSERNVGASLKYDYFLDEKTYLLGIGGWESDSLANLDSRYYLGAGAGYQFREEEDLSLNGEAALTYFSEEFATTSGNEYMAARLAYNLAYKISETAQFQQTAEAFPSLEDSEDFYGKLDSRLRFDISEDWFAQIQWVFDYDNTPAAGAVRDDHRLVLGVGWSF